jgi:hypothetical protein
MIPLFDSFDTWKGAKLVLEFCALFIGWHSSVYYRHSSSCRLNARKSWVVLSEYKNKERQWFPVVRAHLPYCLPFGQGRTIPMDSSNSNVVFLLFLVFQTRCEFHMVFGVVRHELLRSMGWNKCAFAESWGVSVKYSRISWEDGQKTRPSQSRRSLSRYSNLGSSVFRAALILYNSVSLYFFALLFRYVLHSNLNYRSKTSNLIY